MKELVAKAVVLWLLWREMRKGKTAPSPEELIARLPELPPDRTWVTTEEIQYWRTWKNG